LTTSITSGNLAEADRRRILRYPFEATAEIVEIRQVAKKPTLGAAPFSFGSERMRFLTFPFLNNAPSTKETTASKARSLSYSNFQPSTLNHPSSFFSQTENSKLRT
jgi:hypothetical protein